MGEWDMRWMILAICGAAGIACLARGAEAREGEIVGRWELTIGEMQIKTQIEGVIRGELKMKHEFLPEDALFEELNGPYDDVHFEGLLEGDRISFRWGIGTKNPKGPDGRRLFDICAEGNQFEGRKEGNGKYCGIGSATIIDAGGPLKMEGYWSHGHEEERGGEQRRSFTGVKAD